VRRPFSNHDKRSFLYFTTTFVITLILAVFGIAGALDDNGKTNFTNVYAYTMSVLYLILVTIAIVSIALASYRLC